MGWRGTKRMNIYMYTCTHTHINMYISCDVACKKGGQDRHLISPLLRLALRIFGVIIVDEMHISEILIELRDGLRQGLCVGWHLEYASCLPVILSCPWSTDATLLFE